MSRHWLQWKLALVWAAALLFTLESSFLVLTSYAKSPSDEEVALYHHILVTDVVRLHEYRKLTNTSLIKMTERAVRRILWKLDHPAPDQPYGAAEFRQLQQTGGADQPVPENALGVAVETVEKLRNAVTQTIQPIQRAAPRGGAPEAGIESGPATYSVGGIPVGPAISARRSSVLPGVAPVESAGQANPSAGILPLEIEPLPRAEQLQPRAIPSPESPAAGISIANWKWLGPGNIGGRTRAILVHPQDPNIIWVASVAGGIWKTTNGGQSWGPLADFMANLNVSTLAMDPRNSDVIYAGTGEGFYNLDAFRGAGIFRSTNGGATWTQIPTTANSTFQFVNRLAIASDGSFLLAATRRGIFRSTNFGDTDLSSVTFLPVTGITGRDVLDVDCSATQCVAGGRGHTAYYSSDSGTSWSLATGLPDMDAGQTFKGRVELAITIADPNVVYASIDRASGEIYRSDDGGKSYGLRSSGTEYLSGQGWYNNAVWAGDPTNPDLVVVGGLDLHRSTNGGTTLTRISEWWQVPSSAHADHHVIVAHPLYDGISNRTVYFGNDGGIYRNDDILTASLTGGWVALNNNYGVTQFYGAAGNPSSGRIVGGAQDNGTLLYTPPPGPNTGPNEYTAMYGGDGGWSAADPTNPNFMYGEYVYLQIHRSVNGGSSSNYIWNGILDSSVSNRALFIAPFILDPTDANRMLAGGISLWQSTNVKAATPSWKEIKVPVAGNCGPRYLGKCPISAVEAQRGPALAGASNVLAVGYADGQVFLTTDGTASQPTWERIDDNSPLPDRYVTRVRIDPSNVDRFFVTFAGYESGNIWMTSDGGLTWQDLGSQLPPISIYDVAILPGNPDTIYAATEVGLFVSENGGSNWWPTNQGPANVAVQELFWMGPMLVAATHGRGIFWIDLSGVQVVASASTRMAPATESPAGTALPTQVIPTDPANSR
jgi:photosystem II stability/assembly factor-like uncharacterized protein